VSHIQMSQTPHESQVTDLVHKIVIMHSKLKRIPISDVGEKIVMFYRRNETWCDPHGNRDYHEERHTLNLKENTITEESHDMGDRSPISNEMEMVHNLNDQRSFAILQWWYKEYLRRLHDEYEGEYEEEQKQEQIHIKEQYVQNKMSLLGVL
jgi:hypothetical protein